MENSDNLHITPVEELSARKQRLQRLLQEKGIDGAIILQRADLFYFSGTGQDGYLLIPASGESVLLVRKSFERARRESRLLVVEKFRGSKALPKSGRFDFPPNPNHRNGTGCRARESLLALSDYVSGNGNC